VVGNASTQRKLEEQLAELHLIPIARKYYPVFESECTKSTGKELAVLKKLSTEHTHGDDEYLLPPTDQTLECMPSSQTTIQHSSQPVFIAYTGEYSSFISTRMYYNEYRLVLDSIKTSHQTPPQNTPNPNWRFKESK
jgi:hypothetical protein